MKRFILLACILIILLKPASAYIGISPPSFAVAFESGLEREFTLNLFSDNPQQDFAISVQGDLAKYITVDHQKLRGPGKITITMKLPQHLDTPGNQVTYVVVSEDVGNANGINIIGAMRAVIAVQVPYPGKYLEASLSASSVNTGEPVPFLLRVRGLGTEAVSYQSRIEIFDSSNKSFQTINFPTKQIEPQETQDLTYNLNTSTYLPGRYSAVGYVEYGGKTIRLPQVFRLGELYVNVTDYSKVYRPEAINPVYVHVESFWNEPINDVYATIDIPGYNIPIVKTPSINLDPWGNGQLVGYFDTTTITNKTFKAYISVVYEGRRTEQVATMSLKPITNYSFVAAVIGSVVVIVLLVSILVWLSVRLKTLEKIAHNDRKTKKS